jgi:hypothetical protein
MCRNHDPVQDCLANHIRGSIGASTFCPSHGVWGNCFVPGQNNPNDTDLVGVHTRRFDSCNRPVRHPVDGARTVNRMFLLAFYRRLAANECERVHIANTPEMLIFTADIERSRTMAKRSLAERVGLEPPTPRL